MDENISISKEQTLNAELWVDEHGDYLFRYALLRLNNKQVAEDLVQDTFLSALASIQNFQAASSIRTWFVSILKRKIIDYYRKHSRTEDSDSEEIEKSAFREDGHWIEESGPSDWGEHPEQELTQNEFREILRMCISYLQKRMALAFTMKEVDEIDSEQICKDLGISASNLWVLLHRARARLRECLEINWFGKNN